MATTAQQNACIICGDSDCSLRRGLCPKHHARYVKAASQMTSDERNEFEAKLIEKKLLLPSKQGRRLEPEADEFAAAATEFRAEKHAAHPPIETAAKRKTKIH